MSMNPELYKQLLETFRSELDEGLTLMSNELLDLEKNQNNPAQRKEITEKIFRTAHNIKGSSRILGLTPIGEIAHNIENIFHGFKNSEALIPKNTIDLCLEAINKINLVMESTISKKPIPFDLNEFMKKFNLGNTENGLIKDLSSAEKKNLTSTNDEKKIKLDESIRIPLSLVDKISALSEEFILNKIYFEDHIILINKMFEKILTLNVNINNIIDNIKKSNEIINGLEYREKFLDISDLLMDIVPRMTEMSRDNKYLSVNTNRLNRQLQEAVYELRLIPASALLSHLPHTVRDIANSLNKSVDVEIKGGDVSIDKYVLSGLKDPINHILRNAIDHGIESSEIRKELGKPPAGKIVIEVHDLGNSINFIISDDGAGIDYEKIRKKLIASNPESSEKIKKYTENELSSYLFEPGFSTKDVVTDISGRGVGLDIVKKSLSTLKGIVTLSSKMNEGTVFSIQVPLSLSSDRGLIVRSFESYFVFPTSFIQRVAMLKKQDVCIVEGQQMVIIGERTIPLKSLASVFKIKNTNTIGERFPVVVVQHNQYAIAFCVDEVIGEKEIVIKAINQPLSNVSCIEGGTLLERNTIALVINPEQLMSESIHLNVAKLDLHVVKQDKKKKLLHILVVDDSITTRTLEKNILESNNFKVTVAVNGQEAWELVNANKELFSLIITDVSMPVMNGFELTEKIKNSDKFNKIPVIIVTSLGSDAEKLRGVEVGADAYIVKNEFESNLLLKKIHELVVLP